MYSNTKTSTTFEKSEHTEAHDFWRCRRSLDNDIRTLLIQKQGGEEGSLVARQG